METTDNNGMMEVANSSLPLTPPLDADETIARLSELGLSSEAISLVIPVPEKHIRTVLTQRRRVQSPEAAALTEDMRRLTRLAFRKATAIIEFGPPEHRIQLIRAIVGNSTRLLAAEDDSTTQELRAEVDGLYAEMRDVQEVEHVITETDYQPTDENDAVAPPPPAPSSHDQDDQHGVPQTRLELR